jgi:hypothetical protein
MMGDARYVMRDFSLSFRPGTGSLFGTGIFAVVCENRSDNSIELFEMTNKIVRCVAAPLREKNSPLEELVSRACPLSFE